LLLKLGVAVTTAGGGANVPVTVSTVAVVAAAVKDGRRS
jgi:hypothetical protein